MVINRREIKRKRKDNTSNCGLLDESPKRTKVHAQRKFAQGSNVSSPVITPVKEIEKQDKVRPDVLPEPQDILPMNRPHTEDFLTFLCFRGTSMLPPNLNFFNTAPIDSKEHTQPLKHEPIDVCPPLANISAKATAGTSERPFIAFGVRKRADPILVSKHMDKKRRHALALQALRRKYQEQKMAKIRAVTISKLSEKTTSKSLVRTRSVTKNETTTKKSITQKTRVKIVATKHVRVTTRSAIKTPIRTNINSPIRTQIQKRMCLRSFRGRFVQRELTITKPKKNSKIVKKSEGTKKKKETSSEFSSDDDQPLVKTVKVVKPSNKVPLPKVVKKCATGPKKPMEIRVTRASHPLLSSTREQTIKRKIQISRTIPSKSPFVKLTPPKNHSPKQKQKEDKTTKIQKSDIQEDKIVSPKEKVKKEESKKKTEPSPEIKKEKVDLRKKLDTIDTKKKSIKSETTPEKETKKKPEALKKNPETPPEKGLKRKSLEPEKKIPESVTEQKDLKKKTEPEKKKPMKPEITEKTLKKKPESDQKNPDQVEEGSVIKDQKPEVIENKSPEVTEKKIPEEKKPDATEKIDPSAEETKPEIISEPPPDKEIKKKNIKTDSESKKKPNKVEVVEEPRVSQRPTRKTKEAAAIYMEILGHKLVNEGDMDDDSISIDSFPELPNVRKTEQRENELKARAKSKNTENEVKTKLSTELPKTKPKTIDLVVQEPEEATKKLKTEENKDKKSDQKKESVKNKKSDLFSDSDSSMKKNSSKNTIPEFFKRSTRGSSQLNKPLLDISSSDSEEFIPKKQTKSEIKKPFIKTKLKSNEESDSESDESTTSKTSKRKIKKNKKLATKVTATKLDNSFSDSDEEPLSKLTQAKFKSNENTDKGMNLDLTTKNILKRKSLEGEIKKDSKQTKTDKKKTEDDQSSSLILSGKPKRECTKRPQNYLPLFSSSEDEEKFFHGFGKNEAKNTKEIKCHPTTPSADLLCKDVDKRFGKGKVNMSTEQIEKWLKDSAMAGSIIKKENFDILKFDEKIPMLLNLPTKIEEEISKKIEEKPDKIEIKIEPVSKPIVTKIDDTIIVKKIPQLPKPSITERTERKTIFRKERKIPIPNINAFSASNESSVYAFEADNEDIISTPFRRPSRRPSSTATSRSEDSSKYEEVSKGKFRLPPVVKQATLKNPNKQEVSLMVSTDESNNTTSIAVQLDLESADVFPERVNPETSTHADAEEEQLFYIPLQPGRPSSQLIQGVAVKLGTKGPNQRVVMSAKLVTHTPAGAQKLEKPLATSTPMYPPSTTVQKSKNVENTKSFVKSGKACDRMSENSEEFKYKIPSSPSASSSSSTKVTKRPHMKTRIRPLEFCNPINASEFPSSQSPAVLLEAPVFHPNDKEFQDPLEYIEKIRPRAEKFGICRIVPPSTFKPECKVADDMRFTAYNQYVHKMLHRWGPNFKELMAITKYLETQNIALTHPPWIGGMEIDLPRLYQIVQSLGGLKEVIEKKRWPKVSELMKIPKSAQDRVTKLDDIYCKYLLPYDTLSPAEREKLFDEVETEWAKRESRTLLRSQQNINSRDSSPNSSESDSGDEAEECIVKGRNMALNAFYRIARNTMSMWFKTVEPSAPEVEQEFWKHVTVKQNHICVHSGSIDSGNWGYGFAVSKNSPFARHAWNLKVLTNNSGSVLRSMGPVMGVTVPTLHVGMVFSACCWYRDPHRLPWIEYLHTGGNKIWYGIPDSMSEVFRSSLIKLVPNYCRNKSLWLPSDTAMVPPSLLVENGVSLCRTIQEPGQFIVVFPKAFTSSLCTGYVVSESVYFAPLNWLSNAQTVFDELHNSCEPSMFSLEKLLISIASDVRSNVDVLKEIIPAVESLCEKQTLAWKKLEEMGLKDKERLPLPEAMVKKRKRLQNDSGDNECEVCCKNLFISWVSESQDGIYCLDHAIEYIEKKKIEVQNCKLNFTHNDEELKSLIKKMNSTIEMKLQKKIAGKGAAGVPIV